MPIVIHTFDDNAETPHTRRRPPLAIYPRLDPFWTFTIIFSPLTRHAWVIHLSSHHESRQTALHRNCPALFGNDWLHSLRSTGRTRPIETRRRKGHSTSRIQTIAEGGKGDDDLLSTTADHQNTVTSSTDPGGPCIQSDYR